ncbi:MAG: DUF4394 domain-containing protein [Lysobacteraceae bacterium]|nr:MAG: DUF4394 domain-containing protein [Xanthomonadaceae bacterium]
MNKLLLGGLSALLLSTGANAATVFGIDETNNLVTFDSSAPGTIVSSLAITGLTNSFQALDFRPRNNVLYGLGTDKVVYTIDTMTGAATAVSGPLAITGSEFGFDFNPTIDRLRIVSDSNENYVFDPNTGTLATPATPVFYAAGDANEGKAPDVTGAAYTSSSFGRPATTTQLYSLDTAANVLTRQANSAGTLTTVGATGVNLGSRTSFDIAGGDAFAFNGNTLYRVDLGTGALTALGKTDRALFGIAISAVPEPTTWAMMLLGFGMVAAATRYRRRSTSVVYA